VRATACFLFAIAAGTMAALAGPELPRNDDAESIEVEPPLLIPHRESNQSTASVEASPGEQTAVLGPDRIEKALERATQNAAGAERLYKKGVLARVEVEQCFLRVVQLQSELEDARLEQVREEMEVQKSRFARGEISKGDVEKTAQLLAQTAERARAAASTRERAEMEAAENNLRRQRKLMALGSGRKSELIRAEERLAELKSRKR
jgi:hypothetical protein